MAIYVDPHQIGQDATIERNTVLFRLTSPLYSGRADLLNGLGTTGGEGRYHYVQQPTSYLADNALLCMGEVLYHMSRQAMEVLHARGNARQWQNRARAEKHLVMFEMDEISDLIYLDTEDCRTEVQRLSSITMVHPDRLYKPLQEASNYYRTRGNQGIVYPSARHSESLAVALFLDQTTSIKSIRATLPVTLSLVEEGTGYSASPASGFNMHRQKINHTQGHYAFDSNEYQTHGHLLYPQIPESGHVDFVRRTYTTYPDEAVS